MSLDIDQRLGGRYRLEETIGFGGMGRVFRATDELLDRPVAIKLLDQPISSGAEIADEIAEARAAARLSHPGVVHVFDAGISDGQAYTVMELVEGQSLREILGERGKLAPHTAAELASQVADALEAIHRLGMVHCDVKPLNIILTPSGQPKLVDFGIARTVDAVGDSRGSAAYVAPEQARGESVDGRADIYALGAVLYEMLVGRRPFVGTSTTDVLRRRLEADPPRPRSIVPSVPPELEAIVLRALAREPAERYATAAEMRDALRTVLSRAAEPTEVMKPPSAPRVSSLTTSKGDGIARRVGRAGPPAPLVGRRPMISSPAPFVGWRSLINSPETSVGWRSSISSPDTSVGWRSTISTSAPFVAWRSTVSSLQVRLRSWSRRGAAIAALVLIAIVVTLSWRLTHPVPNRVPGLVGLHLSDVPTALEQANIAPAEVTVLTRKVEAEYVGTIVDQQPQPGLPRTAEDGVQIAVGVGS